MGERVMQKRYLRVVIMAEFPYDGPLMHPLVTEILSRLASENERLEGPLHIEIEGDDYTATMGATFEVSDAPTAIPEVLSA